MRRSLFGALFGSRFGDCGHGWTEFVRARRRTAVELVAVRASSELDHPGDARPTDSRSSVTVIDPRQRVMAVYHVDRATGEITPKSVRNFTWDLQMIEFNSGNPLPQDIRSGLQR